MKRAFCVELADKRDIFLAEALKSEGFALFSFGEESNYPDYEKVYIKSVLTELVESEAKNLAEGSYLFSRKPMGKAADIIRAKGIKHFNVLEDETFIVKNAYITAEGALAYILMNTDISINKMNVLVLGYGRVGKAVVKLLKDNYANLYVATDNATEYALASMYAEEVFSLKNYEKHLNDISVIVNTVPATIIKGDTLKLIRKDCFLLDLASKPGGIDIEGALSNNLKAMRAPGIPGKIAPKTAGLYIKDIILKNLSGKNYDER